MTQLKDDLLKWVISEASNLEFSEVKSIKSLREQASLRNYFRIETDINSKVGVISDPNSDTNNLFTLYSKFFLENNLRVPKVEAYDHKKGFLLIEDFGDKVIQLEINKENLDSFIKGALRQIIMIQACKPKNNFTVLSNEDLIEQMALFNYWFLDKLMGLDITLAEEDMIQRAYEFISQQCSTQKITLCHFDFEFRNLMLLDDGSIGILDFQDLCMGPYAIDIASIVKDIENPLNEDQFHYYAGFYFKLINQMTGRSTLTFERLIADIDFASFQRQLRILGTLSRLHLRDKKSFRLFDLIQTLKFLIQDSKKYEELGELNDFLSSRVEPNLLNTIKDIG